MMDTNETATASVRKITLDFDVVVGEKVAHAAGTEIGVRKPAAGELRGLQIMALGQLDYNQLEQLLPRITMPTVHKHEIAAMDPADFGQLAAEVMDFLLPKAAKAASLGA